MKILVTGGGGFLGFWIVKKLLAKKYEVINFSRNHYSHLEELGVKTIIGNLENKDSILSALNDIDAIFHVAALAGVWGKQEDYLNTNYEGSKLLVEAALEKNIKYFIYTSTPSVVFGKDDIEGADESVLFPETYLTSYAYSKSLAEKYILNSKSDSFFPLAIRPHLIWGPGDPHLFPRLLRKAREGKLKRVGLGENLVDIIYVENAADAHVQAFETLLVNSSLAGRAYFIGQEKPVNLWDFINKVIALDGQEPIEDSISFKTAYILGFIFEKIYKLLGISKPEPPMTRFIATQLGKSHYFSHKRAFDDFGYKPAITIEDGLNRYFGQKKESLSYFRNIDSTDSIN